MIPIIDDIPNHIAEYYIVDASGSLVSRDEWRDRRDCAAAFREMERVRRARNSARLFIAAVVILATIIAIGAV